MSRMPGINITENGCLSKKNKEWIQTEKVSLKIWFHKLAGKINRQFTLHMRK